MTHHDAVVVGAGLAGLRAAADLAAAGLDVAVVEASDAVGGRVRSDVVDGFTLDRGFQVLLTGYPQVQAVLDLDALDLRSFAPGALVRTGGRFARVGGPLRRPGGLLTTLAAPVGTPADKVRVGVLGARVRRGDVQRLLERPERTTAELLGGFSPAMVDRFWRPFLGGVLLDPSLTTSSRLAELVLRAFASGDAALPAGGMQAVADQLARRLPTGCVRLGAQVAAVGRGCVALASGEVLRARAVVVATDGPAAARLVPAVADPGSKPALALSYAAEAPPVDEPLLVLDGEGAGPVNHLAVPSAVAPTYAPPGAALVSASVLDDRGAPDPELDAAVRAQLTGWFGAAVAGWRLLAVSRIAHAQPDQRPPALERPSRPVRVARGVYVCGDHRETASIDGALASGARAADAVAADLARAR